MLAIAWMSTAFLAAGILGQVYAIQIIIPLGLGWALSGLAVIYLLTALRLIFIQNKRSSANSTTWLDTYRPIFSLFSNRALCRVYLASPLLLLCFIALYLVLDVHLGDVIQQQGIDKMQMRLIALPAFALTLFAPRLIIRLGGAHKVVTLGLTISAAGLLLTALFTGFEMNWHPAWILAATVVFAAGVALSIPSLIARTAAVTEPSIRGIAVSFYTFVVFFGASLAPFLVRVFAGYSFSFECLADRRCAL